MPLISRNMGMTPVVQAEVVSMPNISYFGLLEKSFTKANRSSSTICTFALHAATHKMTSLKRIGNDQSPVVFSDPAKHVSVFTGCARQLTMRTLPR